MMRNYLIAAFILYMVGSCDEDIEYSRGDMIGYAGIYDPLAFQPPVDLSGIKAQLSVRDPVSDSLFIETAYTDDRGKFLIKDLDRGTYNLVLEKEGYGKRIYWGIQHLGGEPTILGCPPEGFCYNRYSLLMYKIPAAAISSFGVSSGGSFTLGGTVSAPDTNSYLRIIVCISDEEEVDNTEYDHLELSGANTGPATLTATGILDSLSRKLYDYDQGAVLYLKAYLANSFEDNTLNYYNGRQYYFCVSPDASETVSIVYE